MAKNEYHFVTHWQVEGDVQEVSDILEDVPSLARWWPSVYLDVNILEPGDERGVGKVVSLYTKGWLPYRLRWQFRVTESRAPYGSTLEAWGDFKGRGIRTLEQGGPMVDVTYDWKIRADKPPVELSIPSPQAHLRRESSLGNGEGREESKARACPPTCPYAQGCRPHPTSAMNTQ